MKEEFLPGEVVLGTCPSSIIIWTPNLLVEGKPPKSALKKKEFQTDILSHGA